MSRAEFLVDVLDSTFDKENWYAPLKSAMEGLTAKQASWRPPGEATKSIWENVNHLIYYKERLVATLEGREWTRMDGNDTFFIIKQTEDNNDWNLTINRAENVHNKLKELLSQMSSENIKESGLESDLIDILLHDAYHTGQIMLLRKMQGSWPSHR
ncbi:DinB family protein [Fictibacillus nanhaiensis]|uniref:DinB family protein n=1 Tax=Fictibacillus nanhaiensis TaxID=742169 RepID=A0ABS2ZS39_9BACL|nr:DinB family protein [Fictibacillus nanhaiensis]